MGDDLISRAAAIAVANAETWEYPQDDADAGNNYAVSRIVEGLRALPSATQAGGWMPPDIDAIENGGKRWHGEDHRVVSVRWEPYKPDGQRQMKAKGRWQEQVGSGDYWRWQNCERPAFAPLPPAPESAP